MKTELPRKTEFRNGANVALPRDKFQLQAVYRRLAPTSQQNNEITATCERMEPLVELLAQLTGLGYELIALNKVMP